MKIIALITAVLASSFLSAQPETPTVISGIVTVDNANPSLVSIQCNSDRSIVNWDSFSIEEGQSVFFQMPSTSSAILNRVTGELPSDLQGKINSNGTVYLINAQGILIGTSGKIEANTFLASTLDARDQEFMSGTAMNFTATTQGKLDHQGVILANNGNVVLLGYSVNNQGQILASQGQVSIGAGQEILLYPLNRDSIVVLIPSALAAKHNTIDNLGYIKTIKAEIRAGNNPDAYAVNHEGWINAIGTKTEDSAVLLFAEEGVSRVSGLISARNNNDTGGSIHIFGKDILLENYCSLDCSGKKGGGEIFIGGDLQQAGPFFERAQTTTIGPKVKINNDAVLYNNGGVTVVWSEQKTDFAGSISAKGGQLQGNGGLVEICALDTLNFTGSVDNSARKGKKGLLITDPHVLIFNHPK